MGYIEGESSDNQYSVSNSFYVKSQKKYIGKWGHTLIPFHYVESHSLEIKATESKRTIQVRIPALFFIAGDTVGDGSLVRTTFQSNAIMNCVKAGNVLYTGRAFFGPNAAVQNHAIGAGTVPDEAQSRKYGSWAPMPYTLVDAQKREEMRTYGGKGCDHTQEPPYQGCTEEDRNGMHEGISQVMDKESAYYGKKFAVYEAVLQN